MRVTVGCQASWRLANNCMKLMPRLVTAFATIDDACASGLASKARAKPVTAYAER